MIIVFILIIIILIITNIYYIVKLHHTNTDLSNTQIELLGAAIKSPEQCGNLGYKMCGDGTVSNDNKCVPAPVPKKHYSVVGIGKECTNDISIVKKACATNSKCEFIGQQSDGCWHLLKEDVKGAKVLGDYPDAFCSHI